VLLTALVDAVVLVVWALTGAGTFWPGWVIIATGLVLALFGWRKVVGWVVSLGVFVVLVWVLAGGGTFWPVWPLLALAVVLALWWLFVRSRGRLEERIETLETTRAGAVDVQESELRRIERDLHDGAQARLVALGMNLGMAEQKLAVDPEAARDLVTEARLGVEEALRELRDLARGIHPPVLTDRGLEAAIAALANRSAVPVFVDADVRERPPAAVETAAYFVAAEALTNAAKHAGATRVDVRVLREPGTLRVQVSDDGRGDADPAGSGLTGLRHRVEALDGRLTVVSPPGGGTTLLAELPCAS
jgi:signal transduction histidine kinase